MTSAHIPEEGAFYPTRNMCDFLRVQNRLPGLTRISFGVHSDATFVPWMRQSIVAENPSLSKS